MSTKDLNARLPAVRTAPMTITLVVNAVVTLLGVFAVLYIGPELVGYDTVLIGLAVLSLIIQPTVAVLTYQLTAGE